MIRLLQESDARALWDLRAEALGDSPRAFGEALEEHLKSNVDGFAKRLREGLPENFVYGDFRDSRLRGMAGFFRNTGIKRRHRGQVWGMYVAPELRGSGAGRALLEALLDRAQTLSGLEAVVLGVADGNHAAHGLYRALGFVEYGREPSALRVSGEPVTEILMRYEIRRS